MDRTHQIDDILRHGCEAASDSELIDRALGGDPSSYGALFDRYRAQLYAATLGRCGDRHDAQDIMQETFVKAYLNLNHYNADYTFGQWIYTIARNLFIDYTRKKRTTTAVFVDRSEHFNAPSDAPNPEERIISHQRTHQIDAILASMPVHYQRMIELRFYSEYSYEEIAEKLDMPLGTVKTQIHRARERFCRMLTDNKI